MTYERWVPTWVPPQGRSVTIYRVEISGEFEGIPCVGGADLLVNGFAIRLPDPLLALVTPPLPEEPEIGAVVLIDGKAFQRVESHDETEYPEKCWAAAGSALRYSWVQLCALALPGTPVCLIPATR